MKLIIGLGNYGKEFDMTPHNAGFMLVDKLAKLHKATSWEYDKYYNCDVCYIAENNAKKVMLAKPRTYMNLSGGAVAKIIAKNSTDLIDMTLCFDDLDLALGQYKINSEKQPREHKGVESVRSVIGKTGYNNIRIGVETRTSLQRARIPGDVYVIKKISDEDYNVLVDTITEIAKQIDL